MILFKKQLFDLEVKGQGPTKVIMVRDTPPYGHAPTYQISLTYFERQKSYGPEKLCWEEAEEAEEKIRLKQYVSLRSKGRHNYFIHFFMRPNSIKKGLDTRSVFCLSSFCVICPMLRALSLDSPFLIVLLVFSNVNSTKLTFFWIHIPDMTLAFYVGNLLHISYRWHHLETFLLYRQGTLLKMREGWHRNSGTETTGPSGHYEILLELPKPEEL